jgi:hypothetical protein
MDGLETIQGYIVNLFLFLLSFYIWLMYLFDIWYLLEFYRSLTLVIISKSFMN